MRAEKKLLIDFTTSIFQNMVDVMCGEYNDATDKCDSLAPPPKAKSNPKQYASMASIMLDLLESLGSV